jgi:hypothetical protein
MQHLLIHFSSICADYGRNNCGLPGADASSSNLQSILQIVFAILAALSVLFIVIASLRLITSQGNPQETSKARATIAYALVGLIVALLAEAIVSLVLDRLT